MLILAGHIEDAFFWLCLIFYLKLLKYYRSANMDFVDYIMSSSLAVMDTKQNYAKGCVVKNEIKITDEHWWHREIISLLDF